MIFEYFNTKFHCDRCKQFTFWYCVNIFYPWKDIVGKKVSKLRFIAGLRAFYGMNKNHTFDTIDNLWLIESIMKRNCVHIENKAVGEVKDRRIETMSVGEASASTSLFFLILARFSISTRYFKWRSRRVVFKITLLDWSSSRNITYPRICGTLNTCGTQIWGHPPHPTPFHLPSPLPTSPPPPLQYTE